MASVQCLRLFEHFFIVVDVLLAVIAAVAVLYEGRARLPKHLEIIASNFHYCTIRACGNLVSMTVPPYISIAARSDEQWRIIKSQYDVAARQCPSSRGKESSGYCSAMRLEHTFEETFAWSSIFK